ncbi:Coq4 family protein [Sphingobacterium alkalisoli]|nr:Coq4 family protein [Sphingobacterium alkalisoli]
MLHLYGWSSRVYANAFKINKKAWGITKVEFLFYPEGTLGKALGEFYALYDFDVMPKLENHDVFHILTNTGTKIQDEIAMQYLLFGNGKRSLYLFAMIFIGGLIFPEYFPCYIQAFKKGRNMASFYEIEFKMLLGRSVEELRASLELKTNLITIK